MNEYMNRNVQAYVLSISEPLGCVAARKGMGGGHVRPDSGPIRGPGER